MQVAQCGESDDNDGIINIFSYVLFLYLDWGSDDLQGTSTPFV